VVRRPPLIPTQRSVGRPLSPSVMQTGKWSTTEAVAER